MSPQPACVPFIVTYIQTLLGLQNCGFYHSKVFSSYICLNHRTLVIGISNFQSQPTHPRCCNLHTLQDGPTRNLCRRCLKSTRRTSWPWREKTPLGWVRGYLPYRVNFPLTWVARATLLWAQEAFLVKYSYHSSSIYLKCSLSLHAFNPDSIKDYTPKILVVSSLHFKSLHIHVFPKKLP